MARFCLGRFWRTATPAQQQQYLKLFRDMLVVNIASKLGEYKGVTFTLGTTQDRDAGELVATVVKRPKNPPTHLDSNNPAAPACSLGQLTAPLAPTSGQDWL